MNENLNTNAAADSSPADGITEDIVTELSEVARIEILDPLTCQPGKPTGIFSAFANSTVIDV